MLGLVAGGIGPIGIPGVSERHVARAERVSHAQHGQRVVDRVAAFHADEGGNLPLPMDALDVGGCQREFEGVGILSHHLVDDIDLLQHRLDGGRPGGDGRDINRPELGAHTAGAQAGNVRYHHRAELAGIASQVDRAEVVGAFAILPRQVVVAVDERNFAQQLADFGQGGGVWFRGQCLVGGEGASGNHSDNDGSKLGTTAHSSTWVNRASTPRSSRVVVSPLIFVPEAICLSRRRMILPERVFGNASAKRMSSGFATGPISLATCRRSSSRRAPSACTPVLTVTKATSAWPFMASGRPTTAASATF